MNKFDEDFKKKVVRHRLQNRFEPIQVTAEKFGVSTTSIQNWVKRYSDALVNEDKVPDVIEQEADEPEIETRSTDGKDDITDDSTTEDQMSDATISILKLILAENELMKRQVERYEWMITTYEAAFTRMEKVSAQAENKASGLMLQPVKIVKTRMLNDNSRQLFWTREDSADGYDIALSADPEFSTGSHLYVRQDHVASTKIPDDGSARYIKVRSYTGDKRQRHYSEWSEVQRL